MMLEKSGLPISVNGDFEDGEEVIEYLQENEADIIITDIRMPNVDGLELAKYVQEHVPKCSVVIETGYEDFQYARNALRYQVKDYLTKPIEQAALLDAVDRIISRKKQQEISKNRQKEEDILEFSKQQLSVRQLVSNEKLLNRLIENVPDNNAWQKYRLAVIQINDNSEEQQKKMHELLKKWQVLHVVQTVL